MSLSKRSKGVLIAVIIVLIGGVSVYKYMYKPHATIESLEVAFTGTSSDFLSKIQENADAWQNKVVLLSGKITSTDAKGITLNESMYCQFRDVAKLTGLKTTQEIKIKGRIIGYDDLLEELKLDQCIIQK